MPRKFQSAGATEWSVPIDVTKLSADPKTFHIEASDDERLDLAHRMGIVSVESAVADVTLQMGRGKIIHAIATLRAVVTQACVVSLAPVTEHIEEQFEGWFGGDDSAVSFARAKSDREAKKSGMEVEILEESVDPEPIVGGKIDIGEFVTQNLCLALNPYPHAPGVQHDMGVDSREQAPEGASIRKNPFEALKDWKEKR